MDAPLTAHQRRRAKQRRQKARKSVNMVYETKNLSSEIAEIDSEDVVIAPAPIGGTLPVALVMTQRAAALLRAFLDENQLSHYRIFRCCADGVFDAEWHLEALNESAAAWETLPALVQDGEPIAMITHEDNGRSFLWEGGALRLSRHETVLARWYWVDAENYNSTHALRLVAARTKDDVMRLREETARHRRVSTVANWQIVRGYARNDGDPQPRGKPETLLMEESIRQRVEAEIVRFFSSEVAELYRSMEVPYRRGVLLYGPPGNGKTSLIRQIGARLPDVPAMLLRPTADFDSDDFEEVIRRWSAEAPALLVIEDLDWLLGAVNVSTFLNLLDGVDRPAHGGGGLLLIATTNHPEKLDPAVNNRPGRFDVVLRIGPPNRELRVEFLRSLLTGVAAALIEQVADRAAGISFAHLQEIVRLAGLSAIYAGRTGRSERDLLEAAEALRGTFDQAERGFPIEPEQPFGLLPLRDRQKR